MTIARICRRSEGALRRFPRRRPRRPRRPGRGARGELPPARRSGLLGRAGRLQRGAHRRLRASVGQAPGGLQLLHLLARHRARTSTGCRSGWPTPAPGAARRCCRSSPEDTGLSSARSGAAAGGDAFLVGLNRLLAEHGEVDLPAAALGDEQREQLVRAVRPTRAARGVRPRRVASSRAPGGAPPWSLAAVTVAGIDAKLRRLGMPPVSTGAAELPRACRRAHVGATVVR